MVVVPVPANTRADLRRGVDYVGVTCVFFCHDGQGNFVLHKRSQRCRDERGRWDNGAGSLEFGEQFEDAIRREVREEYGANALDIQFVGLSNVLRDNAGVATHWIALVFAVRVDPKEVRLNEPDKMDDLGWFTKDSLPSPLHSQTPKHLAYLIRAGIV